MSKFTPGPWEVEEGHKTGLARAIRGDKENVVNFNGIAHPSKVSGIANAHLISAAPDMYEALENLCRWAEREAKWDKMDNVYYKAKQALAKADGIR